MSQQIKPTMRRLFSACVVACAGYSNYLQCVWLLRGSCPLAKDTQGTFHYVTL